MHKTIITVNMLALVFLSLAGCTSKPSSEHAASPVVQASSSVQASSGAPDPSKILSKAEIESVLGGHVIDIQLVTNEPDIKICYYFVAVPQDPKPEAFMITIGATDKDKWNNFKRFETGDTAKPIPVAGVGDDAYFSPGGGIDVLTRQLMVKIAADGIQLRMSGPDGVKYVDDKSLALARKIVAKLR